MSCIMVGLPSLLSETHTESGEQPGVAQLRLSRFEAVVMLLVYGGFLVFQLKTHTHLFEEEEQPQRGAKSSAPHPRAPPSPRVRVPRVSRAAGPAWAVELTLLFWQEHRHTFCLWYPWVCVLLRAGKCPARWRLPPGCCPR